MTKKTSIPAIKAPAFIRLLCAGTCWFTLDAPGSALADPERQGVLHKPGFHTDWRGPLFRDALRTHTVSQGEGT
jgi:hypothetical protein